MTVIEKVARAMLADELKATHRRDFDQTWEAEGPAWLANARAALEALREPSEAMVRAGDAWTNHHADCVHAIWSAMVDAALNEPAS